MGAGPPCMISPPCVLVIQRPTYSEALSMKLSFLGGYMAMFHEKGSDGFGRSNLLVYSGKEVMRMSIYRVGMDAAGQKGTFRRDWFGCHGI